MLAPIKFRDMTEVDWTYMPLHRYDQDMGNTDCFGDKHVAAKRKFPKKIMKGIIDGFCRCGKNA